MTRSGLVIGTIAAAALAGAMLAAPVGALQAQGVQPDYHPSLGDLMTMAVQPRHIKLGLAGRARNWGYLAYETGELRNAFNRIARTIPTYRNQDMAGMIAANIKDPLDHLEAAVKAKDGRRFDIAYAEVTHACNACHQGLGHPEVVIQSSDAFFYPDQNFGLVRQRALHRLGGG